MVTGRTTIEAALRPVLAARGWAPRARGWFTRPVAPGVLGALAVGVASKRSTAGTATATVHVHLRDEALEVAVARLTGRPDKGYTTTTVATSIGYLAPEGRWREWAVRPETADAVAEEMAQAVERYGEPHLSALAADPVAFLDAITASPAHVTSTGLAREVLHLDRTGRRREAAALLAQRIADLGDRQDAAAADERRVGTALAEQLARRDGSPSARY